MNKIFVVTKRELNSYFNSAIAYVFITLFLFVNALLFFVFYKFFLTKSADVRPLFEWIPLLYIIFIPALTMSLWAEEKRLGTYDLILSFPIKTSQLVLGKYLATLMCVIIAIALTLIIPITADYFGNPDWGTIMSGYIGTVLLAAAYVSIGAFLSVLTNKQINAFIISSIIFVLLFFVSKSIITDSAPKIVVPFLTYIGITVHYAGTMKGVLDTRDIIYYLSIILFFLFMTVIYIENQRWKIKMSSSLSTIILLIIIILFNFIADKKFVRFDFTEEKQFTISKITKDILGNLDDYVNVKCAFSETLPAGAVKYKKELEDMLMEYRVYSKNKIQIEWFDPDKDEESKKKAEALGIPKVQANVIEKDKFELSNIYLGLAITYGDRKEVIQAINNINNLEYELTSRIIRVLQDEDKKIGFVTGHEEYNLYENMRNLEQALSKNYKVTTLNIDGGKEIPEDVKTIIIAGPKKDYTNRDLFEINQFMLRGGRAIFLVEGHDMSLNNFGGQRPPTPHLPKLRKFISSFGLDIQNNLIGDLSCGRIVRQNGPFQVAQNFPYYPQIQTEFVNKENPAVQKLAGLIFPFVSSITTNNSSEKYKVEKLISTTKYSWEKTGPNLNPYILIEEKSTPPKDEMKSYDVAYALTGKFENFFKNKALPKPEYYNEEEGNKLNKEQVKKDKERNILKESNNESTIILVGDAGFVDEKSINLQENTIFMLNMIDWLTLNKELTSLRSKTIGNRVLEDSTSTQKFWFKFINLVGLPFVIILFGIIRIFRRKRNVYVPYINY